MSYLGKWRIIETSAWDTDYLDDSEDACIEFTKESGIMTFGYVHIEMEVSKEQIDDIEILGYSFIGNDEDDEVAGWGWFKQSEAKDEMDGRIHSRYGESSSIKIAKYKKGR